jgi:hypothetical protein
MNMRPNWLAAMIMMLAVVLTACTSAPTKTEHALFDIRTNRVQEVVAAPSGLTTTNLIETYEYRPGAAQDAVEIGGAAGSALFGPVAAGVPRGSDR